MIRELDKNSKKEVDAFIRFFIKNDYLFIDPFSNHVDINIYCEKLLKYAYICIDVDKEINGIACAYINDFINRKSFFQVLLIDKTKQNKHIGKALCQQIINKSKELNMKSCQLTVDSSNETAIALYKKIGFVALNKIHDNPNKQYMIMYL